MRKKIILSSSTLIVVGSSLATVIACGNDQRIEEKQDQEQQIKHENGLGLYQATLWSISPERKALMGTQFGNAKRQFKEVLAKNLAENEEAWDTNAIQLEWEQETKAEDVKVTYQEVEKGKFIPAVVVDLDETFMDNTMYQVYSALHKEGFAPLTWYKWIQAKNALIYERVLEFVKEVWASGAMILFASNRNQGDQGGDKAGDHLVATRENLLNESYPAALLDSHLWWMQGVLTNEDRDQGQTAETLTKLKTKESRYNYINRNRISSRSAKQLGIQENQMWEDSNQVQNLPVQIIMKVGDDINDFNDNFTKKAQSPETEKTDDKVKAAYMNDQDIKNLYGEVAPRVWFEVENNKIIKYYDPGITNPDESLKGQYLENVLPAPKDDVTAKRALPNVWQTYTFIGGNAMYGGWLNSLQARVGKNITGLTKALKEYYDANDGANIFGEVPK